MFQKMLLRPTEYDVVATSNLNGDYLSDAIAAEVGGVGIAPGANIGDEVALFEATHGTAPKYTNLDVVNPGSLLFSGVMMLEWMGWWEAADLITKGYEKTIAQKRFRAADGGCEGGQNQRVRDGGDRQHVAFAVDDYVDRPRHRAGFFWCRFCTIQGGPPIDFRRAQAWPGVAGAGREDVRL
jgi:hypothetical protein